jgi:hypothetical protein
MDYAGLIGLGIQFLQAFLGQTKAKLPVEILTSTEALIAALEAHKDDVLTKANFEAQRG